MSQKTILVVDDSPTERTVIARLLSSTGCTIKVAVDGEEALEKANSAVPDLILLDIILPKKNGFQVCRQLKTSAATKDVPVILVSSKSQESDRFWGLKQGADDYLTKPLDELKLVNLVGKYI